MEGGGVVGMGLSATNTWTVRPSLKVCVSICPNTCVEDTVLATGTGSEGSEDSTRRRDLDRSVADAGSRKLATLL